MTFQVVSIQIAWDTFITSPCVISFCITMTPRLSSLRLTSVENAVGFNVCIFIALALGGCVVVLWHTVCVYIIYLSSNYNIV